MSSRDLNGHRAEAKRLEDKIAVVAAKRCRPEELQALLKDIEEWLRADIQLGGKGMGTVCQGGELIVRICPLFSFELLDKSHFVHCSSLRPSSSQRLSCTLFSQTTRHILKLQSSRAT